MIDKDLKKYAKNLAGYTDLCMQENRTLDINIANGSVISNTQNCVGGVCARIYRNGSWGFASSVGMDAAAVTV